VSARARSALERDARVGDLATLQQLATTVDLEEFDRPRLAPALRGDDPGGGHLDRLVEPIEVGEQLAAPVAGDPVAVGLARPKPAADRGLVQTQGFAEVTIDILGTA
jgi:hypothetical protein